MIRSIYFETFVISTLIFLAGIMFGIWLDNYRLSNIRQSLLAESIFWDDILFLSKSSSLFAKDFCDKALELNLLYNQRIYERGKEIEQAIRKDIFLPEMKEELKRYTLMQVQFWMNSIELRERCNYTYHTVVHLQEFYPKNFEAISDNRAQANIMLNLKERCGSKIMLIPVNVDLNLTSVDAILSRYEIKKFPAVIIDEKYIFQGLTSFETLNKITEC
jgi:hypothetical protein